MSEIVKLEVPVSTKQLTGKLLFIAITIVWCWDNNLVKLIDR